MMLKQVGANHDFLILLTTLRKFEGSASTKSPCQFRCLSKNSVFERVSPSRAPHSTKNPPVCTQNYKLKNFGVLGVIILKVIAKTIPIRFYNVRLGAAEKIKKLKVQITR
jgi:hypothetical protein